MRKHGSEPEVRKIIDMPPNSKERRQALILLRNDTNFDLYIKGTIRPIHLKIDQTEDSTRYYPCAYCKGVFLKNYLRRHARSCPFQKRKSNDPKKDHLSQSQTVVACAVDPTNVVARLNVKEKVCTFIFTALFMRLLSIVFSSYFSFKTR